MKVYFREIQRFRQWWMILFIVAFTFIWGAAIYYTHYLKESFGTLDPDELNLFYFIVPVLTLFLLLANLKTEIREDGFAYRFFPFQFRKHLIKWDQVEHIYLRKWSLREFWGWGIRYNFKMIAYTTMGFQGIQINLKNGKKYLFGTQKPGEITEAMKKVLI